MHLPLSTDDLTADVDRLYGVYLYQYSLLIDRQRGCLSPGLEASLQLRCHAGVFMALGSALSYNYDRSGDKLAGSRKSQQYEKLSKLLWCFTCQHGAMGDQQGLPIPHPRTRAKSELLSIVAIGVRL
jgi:hypothetical protein